MNYSLLDKLTIVIFTYNRHKFLRRTIEYWTNYNVKLVILDGSNTKLEDKNLKNKNILYVHNTKGLYDRLLSSKDYIDTEFMILSADDEFYLPSALSSCIEFLTLNSSFSSCSGRAIGFGRGNRKKIYGKRVYPRLTNLSLDQDNVKERVLSHFSNYVPAHFYSVIRFNKWKKICSYVFRKRYNFGAAHELQLEFLVVVSGKSKIIPELMWMRNNKRDVPKGSREMINLEIKDWWFDKNFSDEKLNFLNEMSKACNDLSSNTNFKFNVNEISEIFRSYIYKTYKDKLNKKSFLKKEIDLILSWVKKIKKTLIQEYKIRNDIYRKLQDEVNLLETEGVEVNHKEFNQVISSIEY